MTSLWRNDDVILQLNYTKFNQLMIFYYSTKFHFIIINSFRVIGRGHFPSTPPPPSKLRHPQKAQVE